MPSTFATTPVSPSSVLLVEPVVFSPNPWTLLAAVQRCPKKNYVKNLLQHVWSPIDKGHFLTNKLECGNLIFPVLRVCCNVGPPKVSLDCHVSRHMKTSQGPLGSLMMFQPCMLSTQVPMAHACDVWCIKNHANKTGFGQIIWKLSISFFTFLVLHLMGISFHHFWCALHFCLNRLHFSLSRRNNKRGFFGKNGP